MDTSRQFSSEFKLETRLTLDGEVSFIHQESVRARPANNASSDITMA
jgi:hypothetical protein